MSRFEAERSRIERWFREALASVDPRASVRRALGWDGSTLTVADREVPVSAASRLVVIAIGKAAPAMALGARDVLGERIDHGVVLTKAGNLDVAVGEFHAFEASHPTPDERGLEATRAIIDAVRDLSADDVVLALISGGGSALLELPRDGISLEDVQATTTTLMHAGAGIHDLNAVRQVLSEVKGGGLRRIIGRATCVSLLLSDVLGNDPHVIASGPTVPLPADGAQPGEVVRRFGVEDALPAPVRDQIEAYERPPAVADERDVVAVIADNETLVREIRRIVSDEGLRPDVVWHAFDGDARDLGQMLVADARSAPGEVDVLLGGGEATVEVTGDGRGGRNTEAALAAAMALGPGDDWVIASLASDGDDGMADAAGAIADPHSLERGKTHGCDAEVSLAENDSGTYFECAGGLVVTGPTGTNVNDVYVALRVGSAGNQEQG